MSRSFRQVDVFCTAPFTGNPVAVVAEADDLSDEQMRAVSRWTNLSECTFLLRPTTPGVDYRVRIFALDAELPFAGHPTLGTARAWLDLGGRPKSPGRIIQQCAVGEVEVCQRGDRLAFRAPPLRRRGPVTAEHRELLRLTLGVTEDQLIDAAWADNGPGWVAVRVDSAATLRSIAPDPNVIPDPSLKRIGVVAPSASEETSFELRAFIPDSSGSFREDPVTGSLNASVAEWLISTGVAAAPYTAEQGSALSREGRIYVEQDDQGLWIGGRADVTISGTVHIGP